MAELAKESEDNKAERVSSSSDWSSKAWAPESQVWQNQLQRTSAEAGMMSLPTLHLNDNRLNVYDNYSVNSDVAQLYIKNRPAIVRINTVDPKADASFSTSAGSGSIVDSTGIIATGYHVVKDATALRVKTADGKIYEATLLDADAAKDQALIKIKSNNPWAVFPTVNLASDSYNVGPSKDLVALGFPKNQDAMHVSQLSADRRMPLSSLRINGGLLLGEDPNREVLKAVGPVFNGNSGGPVFDAVSGKQVGIVNMNDRNDTYVTPVEDLQRFMARTKAKYNLNTLPVQLPADRAGSTFDTPRIPSSFTPTSWSNGLQNLDRIIR